MWAHACHNASQECLNLAGTRNNRYVVVSSPVTRVLFKDEKNAAGDVIASGVEFVHEGKTYTGRAKREVFFFKSDLYSAEGCSQCADPTRWWEFTW